jgi:uncharacterized protein
VTNGRLGTRSPEPDVAVVRCYAELTDLVPAPEVSVVIDGKRSVKDAIGSIGIPHVEVALIVVDGNPVGFEHALIGGERVAVYPPFRTLPPSGRVDTPPATPLRFAVDVHLGTLARRLRLLGFDTFYANDADDATLAAITERDGRILLSRDRQLLMRRSVVHGYLPRSDEPERQLVEVVERYHLDVHAEPLTRCVSCNGRLRPAELSEVADRIPPKTRAAFDDYAECTDCGQVYWPGAHLPAIDAILAGVTDGEYRSPTPGHRARPAGPPPPGSNPDGRTR